MVLEGGSGEGDLQLTRGERREALSGCSLTIRSKLWAQPTVGSGQRGGARPLQGGRALGVGRGSRTGTGAGGWGEQPRLPPTPGHGAGGRQPSLNVPTPAPPSGSQTWPRLMGPCSLPGQLGGHFRHACAWMPPLPRLAEDREHSLPPPAAPALLIPSKRPSQECLAYSGGRALATKPAGGA